MSTAGNARWSAPEKLDIDARATSSADVYSFAMVLYELATRRLPFEEIGEEAQIGIQVLVKKRRPDVSHVPASEG